VKHRKPLCKLAMAGLGHNTLFLVSPEVDSVLGGIETAALGICAIRVQVPRILAQEYPPYRIYVVRYFG
jgi:hypothetical protein